MVGDVQVINFDAYQYAENFALYGKDIQGFLKRGGMVGWGIVPVVKEDLDAVSRGSLIRRLEKGIRLLVEQGVNQEMLVRASWVLPSCETVLLTPEDSDRVFWMTREISDLMKKRYGFL
ncbi:MAG: hypothetical protein R6U38_05960 [Desulfatiglandaceae bacterium]